MSRLRFGNWPILPQVLAGPFVVLLALALTMAIATTSSERLQVTSDLVAHSLRIQDEASELTKLVVDMETGIRGYALTRDEAFLQPYLEARDQTRDQIALLRRLASDHPGQQARLDRVESIIADWQNVVANEQILITRAGGDVSPIIRQGGGKQRTDAVRGEMRGFQAVEEQLLTRRSEDDAAARRLANDLFKITTLVAIAAFVLAFLAGRQIVTPVRAFASAARRVASGDLKIDLPVDGTNELAHTAKAFNVMARSLAEARQHLILQNAALAAQARAAERARGEARAILDATSDTMVLVSPDRQVLSVNRSFHELLFGGAAAEVVGRRLEDLHEEVERIFADPAGFLALVTDTAADPDRQFTQIVAQRWPQARELALFSTPVHSGDQQHLGRLHVFRDVTREREVDRMKTEFVSLVSHELRTPLTSIKGYVDLLIEGEVGELEAEQREFLAIVKNNADRLVALINDLLDISRIESGRIELKRTALDLARLIQEVASSLRPAIEAKEQQLTLDLAGALPPVLGDADRVTQILTNLLSNAHKYTPLGGRIAIVARAEHGRARVDVRDTGIGLSPDEQAQLFTKFFRARNRVTQEVGGTGLGLAITRSLVEVHGGEITVASTPGQGSTFSFTLPAARGTDATDRPQAPPTLAGPGHTVLVVDDESDIANLIRRYLERAGYQVLVAHSAVEALRLAQSEQPDLITLDILLPDADGFTVLEWLKNEPTTRAIPVVVLSIVDDNGRGKLLGAIDYLHKPVGERVLLEHVGRILASDRPRLVLVVDDEADVRALLGRHLRQAGYQVIEAADGAEAVALAQQRRPGLLLMDIRMPGMDGVAALRALRAGRDTRHLPVVMMTATPGTLEENRSVVEALGGATLLSKPCTPEELAAAIARGLAGRSPA